jgi:hypothetical protein
MLTAVFSEENTRLPAGTAWASLDRVTARLAVYEQAPSHERDILLADGDHFVA